MTTLLIHTVAHSTKHFFRPKTNNNLIEDFLRLAVSWVKVIKNWRSFWKIKWFKNWTFQKMSMTKSVLLKWYFSTTTKNRKIRIIFDIENWFWCLVHVVHKHLISILVTDYIQKRRGQALLFSFEYNLLPNLI